MSDGIDCAWTYDESTCSWDTECDNKHVFLEGGPEDNYYKFCPYCSGVLWTSRRGDKEPEPSPRTKRDALAVEIVSALKEWRECERKMNNVSNDTNDYQNAYNALVAAWRRIDKLLAQWEERT